MAELINRLDLLEKMALSHKMHANNSREASLLDRDLLIVFEQPATTEREIREKAIDEFVNALINYQSQDENYKSFSDVCYEIAEQLKGGAE